MKNDEEKLRKIMDNTIVVDTLSHGPILWTDYFVKIADKLLSSETNPFKIVQDLIAEFAIKVVKDNDYFEKLKNAWKNSGVKCVSWTLGPIHEKPYSLEGVKHNLAYLTYMIDNRREFFVKILKGDDFEALKESNKVGIIYNFQDLGFIGTDLSLIEYFYLLGVRVMQLTYNSKNTIGTGCTARKDRGLTEFGLSVIEKLNDLGVLIDVSHCGSQTSMDAIENSKDPVVATHTIAKKINDHDRAKNDDLLLAIAEKKGYVGVLAVPGFITNKAEATINDWLEHIDYLVDLLGIDHVGIGTDYYGYSLPDNVAKKIDEFISVLSFRPEHKASFLAKMQGFENYESFPNLLKGLLSRGYSIDEIKKISGENFMRVFKKVVG